MLEILHWLLIEQSAWWASVIGIATLYFMGNKARWAPWLGAFGQAFWLVLAYHTNQPGLLVACAAYGFVYVRAGLKWGDDAIQDDLAYYRTLAEQRYNTLLEVEQLMEQEEAKSASWKADAMDYRNRFSQLMMRLNRDGYIVERIEAEPGPDDPLRDHDYRILIDTLARAKKLKRNR